VPGRSRQEVIFTERPLYLQAAADGWGFLDGLLSAITIYTCTKIILQCKGLIFQIDAAASAVVASSPRRYICRGGRKAQREATAMAAIYTAAGSANKKPPAAMPALQPAALSRLSRADNEHRRRASCLT
jgi:hypothetical protein